MSRIYVASKDHKHVAEVTQDDEGYASARCLCRWRTDPGRLDSLADVIDEAGAHVDGLDR